jgi:CDGSH-type Zn-finger protein
MSEPIVVQKMPMSADVEEGKSYYWCACGKSAAQPFCDGSHKGSDFVPKEYKADATRTVFFCACKHTDNAPLCDGSHSRI